ncbi:hypothetical protein ACFY9C_34990 [Streptomyces filamentosus]|uniref:hypothetical protein n=1 Tax=Streptomyces filamentosus TaxID=67294 RepID=UPI0036E00C0A
MRISDRLVARLREELPDLGIPEGATLHRTHAEATPDDAPLSWFALGPDGSDLRIGSRIPMGRLLREPVIVAAREPYSSSFDPHTEVGLPADIGPDGRDTCTWCASAAQTACRICRTPLCPECFTTHHHEGYGTPADQDW